MYIDAVLIKWVYEIIIDAQRNIDTEEWECVFVASAEDNVIEGFSAVIFEDGAIFGEAFYDCLLRNIWHEIGAGCRIQIMTKIDLLSEFADVIRNIHATRASADYEYSGTWKNKVVYAGSF